MIKDVIVLTDKDIDSITVQSEIFLQTNSERRKFVEKKCFELALKKILGNKISEFILSVKVLDDGGYSYLYRYPSELEGKRISIYYGDTIPLVADYYAIMKKHPENIYELCDIVGKPEYVKNHIGSKK